MPEDISLLENVRIAAPCPANWHEMVGGDRVRYCRSCEKNVYNLSEMSRTDAEKLLQTHEGRLCVRYYRRTDGTIMTNNCPIGLRTIRKVYLKTAASAAALFGVLFGGIASMGARKQEPQPQPEAVAGGISLTPPPIPVPPKQKDPELGRFTAGDIAPPHYKMGRPVFTPVTHPPKIDPSVEVSDNMDDEDDAK